MRGMCSMSSNIICGLVDAECYNLSRAANGIHILAVALNHSCDIDSKPFHTLHTFMLIIA